VQSATFPSSFPIRECNQGDPQPEAGRRWGRTGGVDLENGANEANPPDPPEQVETVGESGGRRDDRGREPTVSRANEAKRWNRRKSLHSKEFGAPRR
jgi:hypothetical protein